MFQFWNQHRFANPFTVSRSDMMTLSKIKSKTTYSKCLKELMEWNYIIYEPSNNPLNKSRFSMINIWSSTWPKKEESHDSTSPNNGLPLDYTSPNNGPPVDQSVPLNGPPLVPLYKTYKHKHINVEVPPDQKNVIDFFISQNSTKEEGLKFWNHFQSTDWKSGNTKITNWDAAATKWLIGNKQKNGKGLVQKLDYLHTTQNKDYGKPL